MLILVCFDNGMQTWVRRPKGLREPSGQIDLQICSNACIRSVIDDGTLFSQGVDGARCCDFGLLLISGSREQTRGFGFDWVRRAKGLHRFVLLARQRRRDEHQVVCWTSLSLVT